MREGTFFGTWTAIEENSALVPYNPCGRGVDILRRSYKTQCQFLDDDSPLQTILWYNAAKNAPVLPFSSPVSSLDWATDPWTPTTVGEVWGADRSFVNQRAIPFVTTDHICGGEDDWSGHAKALPPDEPMLYNGLLPICCNPIITSQGGIEFYGAQSPTLTGPCYGPCMSTASELWIAGTPLKLTIPYGPWVPVSETVNPNDIYVFTENAYQWYRVFDWISSTEDVILSVTIGLDPVTTCWYGAVLISVRAPLPAFTAAWSGNLATDNSIDVDCSGGTLTFVPSATFGAIFTGDPPAGTPPNFVYEFSASPPPPPPPQTIQFTTVGRNDFTMPEGAKSFDIGAIQGAGERGQDGTSTPSGARGGRGSYCGYGTGWIVSAGDQLNIHVSDRDNQPSAVIGVTSGINYAVVNHLHAIVDPSGSSSGFNPGGSPGSPHPGWGGGGGGGASEKNAGNPGSLNIGGPAASSDVGATGGTGAEAGSSSSTAQTAANYGGGGGGGGPIRSRNPAGSFGGQGQVTITVHFM